MGPIYDARVWISFRLQMKMLHTGYNPRSVPLDADAILGGNVQPDHPSVRSSFGLIPLTIFRRLSHIKVDLGRLD
jgi:hypothetical protein